MSRNGLADEFEQFRDWICSICVVTFDLELGQVIEATYPDDARLPEQTRANICYLSFPDSNSTCSQDTFYHFRVKSPGLSLSPCQKNFAGSVPVSIQPKSDELFGFVHFRQQKNPNLTRGYYQKSIVILTHLPFFGLFQHVVESVAYAFFDSGSAILEAGLAVQHIKEWPKLVAGQVIRLPWMGTVIQCRLPTRSDIPQGYSLQTDKRCNVYNTDCVTMQTVHETSIFQSTKCILANLQTFWELMLLGEPLVVMGPNPATTSRLVQGLVSLVWPLEYGGDYRPFFTIHDSDFSTITSAFPIPSVVLGVTNPFFSKALSHWPHFLRITDPAQTLNSDKLFKRVLDGKTLDNKPGLYTQYRPFLSTDKGLVKRLLNLGNRPDSVQDTILRRHFLELTQSFMIPLERYLSSLMPLRKHISPFRSVPQMKAFELDDFLNQLKHTGPMLTSDGVKGDWVGLYKRFRRSPNFDAWLQMRLKDVEDQLAAIHLDVLCTADLSAESIRARKQVEIVDLVLKIKNRMDESGGGQRREILQAKLNQVMEAVDEDLRSILLSNATLRDLFV